MKKSIRLILICILLCLSGCAGNEEKTESLQIQETENDIDWGNFNLVDSMELSYATEFAVQEYEKGYKVLHINNEGDFLLIPEHGEIPKSLPQDMHILQMPVKNIYLLSTSAMDFFRVIDGIDAISYTGTKKDDWYVQEAIQAMEQENLQFAGKYNSPDYEMLLEGDCQLALENTMIYHNPEVKEQLEKLGISVMVERSSYEKHPFGRMEWVKLYGVLIDKQNEAETFFQKQIENMDDIISKEKTGKTVAFFYITSNGAVSIRKPNDYIAKMIEIAGGEYIFADLEVSDDNALSTMKMQMEDFYMHAKDADILIYNNSIDGEMNSIEELYEKSMLFEDFKAVQNGHVYCTGKNMFQQTAEAGCFIEDLYKVIRDEKDEEYVFLKRLSP